MSTLRLSVVMIVQPARCIGIKCCFGQYPPRPDSRSKTKGAGLQQPLESGLYNGLTACEKPAYNLFNMD